MTAPHVRIGGGGDVLTLPDDEALGRLTSFAAYTRTAADAGVASVPVRVRPATSATSIAPRPPGVGLIDPAADATR